MVIKMKMKELVIDSRPRERLISNGVESLSNEELLAIIINTGSKDKSALDLSREIINSNINIKNLFNLSYEELIKINGIKASKASSILAAFELSKRALSYNRKSECFENSKSLYEYLYPLLSMETHEALYVLYLDSKLQLIRGVMYSVGSVSSLNVPKQRLLTDGVRLGARFVVLSHNHPSGDSLPSKADIDITEDIKRSFELLGVHLIEHIIIGSDEYYSFSDEGIL